MGGALISAKELELGGYYDLKIFLNDTEEFLTKVKILRKVIVNDNFEYGVKFEELTGKNQSILSREIVKFEKKNLDSFRSMKGNSYNNYDKKINILNYNKIENVDIRETLMKIGAGNYEVLYNFKYYIDFFIFEKPDILIIDTENINDNITNIVSKVKENFQSIIIILVVPFELSDITENNELLNNIIIIYRPLVYNEFEDIIVKYL